MNVLLPKKISVICVFIFFIKVCVSAQNDVEPEHTLNSIPKSAHNITKLIVYTLFIPPCLEIYNSEQVGPT